MHRQGIEEWSVTDNQNRMLLRGRPGHCYPSPVLPIRSLHSSHLKFNCLYSYRGQCSANRLHFTLGKPVRFLWSLSLTFLIYNKQEQNYNETLLSKSFFMYDSHPKENDDATTSQIFSIATSCGVVCVVYMLQMVNWIILY